MITYLKGDATEPVGEGPKVIAHITNDNGGWGAGFVLCLSNKWDSPEFYYRKLANEGGLKLGLTQIVEVGGDIYVANMCAQHFYATKKNPVPLRYWALKLCLETVAKFCRQNKASVHMPKIGSGLAMGNFDKIKLMIEKVFDSHVPVKVYSLDGNF